MSEAEKKPKNEGTEPARRRAGVILKVWSKEVTATEAAAALGVSRKTYYKWEDRALSGMIEGLIERGEGGRPPKPADPEKERLEKEVEALKKKVLEMEQRQEIREILRSGPGPEEREGRTEKKGGGT